MSQDPIVHSFYKSNIDDRLVDSQKRVFDHLGIPLDQRKDNRATHAGWMEDVLSNPDEDVTVIADIDAFPCSVSAYRDLVSAARGGALAGLAQVANHKDPTAVYAAPMFLAMPSGLYKEFGSPRLEYTKTEDVAQVLTNLSAQQGRPVSLVYPKFAIKSKWPLAHHGVYGIGTFYGDLDFFHLFESRKGRSIALFEQVANGVIRGEHDFAEYLRIMDEEPPKRRFRWF